MRSKAKMITTASSTGSQPMDGGPARHPAERGDDFSSAFWPDPGVERFIAETIEQGHRSTGTCPTLLGAAPGGPSLRARRWGLRKQVALAVTW